MTGSTPAPGDAAGWQAFTASVVALLGDREPLAVLAELVPALERAVEGLDADALRRPEAPGRWSVAGVIGHLVDTELVFSVRVRQVLTQDAPALASIDQDAWAATGGYEHADVGEMLGLLRLLRDRNLRLYAGLAPPQWERVGVHGDRGPESLRRIVTIVAGHDLAHRRQIARIRASLAG